MSKNELRGASRREFVSGAMAMGAALGWGPARIKEFLSQSGGDALADTKPCQNLVLLVGQQGAHGYPHLLFPQPDSFTGHQSDELALHFMQTTAATGGTPANLTGSIPNLTNYGAAGGPAMTPSRGLLGAWSAGERFKRVFGVDNMAFGGFQSTNQMARNLDNAYWNVTNGTNPKNADLTADKKFIVANRETPWLDKYGLAKAITSIDGGGINPFHITAAHNHYVDFNKKWSVMAAAATIQQTRPTITPVIFIGDMQLDSGGGTTAFYGNLPGAPTPATVLTAQSAVDLFNSNAAKGMGVLSNPKNAQLFEAYTKGWIGNSKTAAMPTFSRGYKTAKLASNLVGLNLADKLLPTAADKQRYGYTAESPPKLTSLRDSLIVTAKALALGLTSQVIIGYGNDDPHDLFTSGGNGGINATTFSVVFGNFLNAFMDDLMAVKDPFAPSYQLGDNTVVAFIGDTPRTGISRNNWNDPSYGGQNRAWIMSNGLLKTGFFGGDRAQFPNQGGTSNDHNAAGPGEGGLFDRNTGDFIPFSRVGVLAGDTVDRRREYGETAMAAILYAVTRGDIRRVNDFYSGKDFPAIQVPVLL